MNRKKGKWKERERTVKMIDIGSTYANNPIFDLLKYCLYDFLLFVCYCIESIFINKYRKVKDRC